MKRFVLLLFLLSAHAMMGQITSIGQDEDPFEVATGQIMDITSGDILMLTQKEKEGDRLEWSFKYIPSNQDFFIRSIFFDASTEEMMLLYTELRSTMEKTKDLRPSMAQSGRKLLQMNLGTNYMSLDKYNTRKWSLIFINETKDNSFSFIITKEQLDSLFGFNK